VLDELNGFRSRDTKLDTKWLWFTMVWVIARVWSLLDEAIERREDGIFDLKANPLWQNLRSEPRTIALLNKMGLDK
jgi:hypothetical protein